MEELNILEQRIDAAISTINDLKGKNSDLINEINDLRQKNIEVENHLSTTGNEMRDRVNGIIGRINEVIEN